MAFAADQALCGTTTAGTGALTLAAPPAAINGADPYAAFSGMGLGTTTGFLVPASIVEYTDSTLQHELQSESGLYTLKFGANLAASTLARTLIFQTVTSMNSQPATVNGPTGSAPTAITIGTAANVVVYFGPVAWLARQSFSSYVTASGSDGLGVCPTQFTQANGTNAAYTSGTVVYQRVEIATSMWIKSVSLWMVTAFGGTSCTLSCALYEVGSDGNPGKKLLNFANNTTIPTNANTLAATTALWVPAGTYYLGILYVGVGQTTAPNGRQANSVAASPLGTCGTSAVGPSPLATVAAQSALNDPATLTSISTQKSAGEYYCAFRST